MNLFSVKFFVEMEFEDARFNKNPTTKKYYSFIFCIWNKIRINLFSTKIIYLTTYIPKWIKRKVQIIFFG